MASKASRDGATATDLLPAPYHFALLIFPPCLIFPSLLSALLDPASFFESLAPSSEPLNYTPHVWSLFYMYIASMAFSGIIEPALVYKALYKLESVRDAQIVLQVVECAMGVFDVMHAVAIRAVAGQEVVSDWYAGVHFWIPVGFFMVRTLWFLGVGRKVVSRDKME